MTRNQLAFIATNDLAAQTRGRSMFAKDVDFTTGCGWVPANLGIGPFGKIVDDHGFGSTGDLRLVPDKSSEMTISGVPNKPELKLFLADIRNIDGTPWQSCPRTFLREAVEEFRAETGLDILSAFEHEFMIPGDDEPEPPFSLQAFRRLEPFGTELVHILESAGLEPETWLPEYGEHQWEVTLRPASPLVAADRAVVLRDIVRDYAHALGRQATFAPLLDPDGTGNGVHVHFSFLDADGNPVMHDADEPGEISRLTGSFAAGVLRHAAALTAIAAPSDVSYLRLSPHRWSAASSFLGQQNREAFLRICPPLTMDGRDPAGQINLEFRAADATSNPWILLGSLIRAGLQGIRDGLAAPLVVNSDLEDLSETEREAAGITELPGSLEDALDALEADEAFNSWFGPDLLRVHKAIKRAEIEELKNLSNAEKCERYSLSY